MHHDIMLLKSQWNILLLSTFFIFTLVDLIPPTYFGHIHVAVLEAAASGSKLHFFKYLLPDNPCYALYMPSFKTEANYKNNKTLFYLEKEDMKMYLNEFLEFLMKNFSVDILQNTELYFVPTDVKLKNDKTSKLKNVLEAVDALLSDHSFNKMLYKPGVTSRVLTGIEEGIYRWVAVNYFLGTFSIPAPKITNPIINSGVIDIDASSLKVVFQPKYSVSSFDFKEVVKIFGKRYELYVRNFINYGTKEFNTELIKTFVKNAKNDSNTEVFSYPCNLKGDSISMLIDGQAYEIEGIGDADECRELILPQFPAHNSAECVIKPCLYHKDGMQPPIPPSMNFFLLGDFIYVPTIFKLDPNSTEFFESLKVKSREFCGKTLEEHMMTYRDLKKTCLTELCLSSNYMELMFTQSLGLSGNSGKLFLLNREIVEFFPGWSLGLVIMDYEKNKCKGGSVSFDSHYMSCYTTFVILVIVIGYNL